MSTFSTLLAALIVFGILYVPGKIIYNTLIGHKGKVRHCMTCGVEAESTIQTKGSFGIEVLLWLLFIVPGLIYSVWRVSSRQPVCASCGGSALVRLDSPAAVNQRKTMQA